MKYVLNKNIAVLVLVILFFSINHILHTYQNKVYISGDQHQYVGIAVDYVKIYHNPSVGMFKELLDAAMHRPPMYPFLVSISFMIFGLNNPTFYGALVNTIFIVILSMSIYGISQHYFKNNLISITSVVVGLSYPLQVILGRQVMTELPLTALTALTMLLLLKSNNLENKKYALLASASFGVSLLTRFTAPFYIFLPIIYLLYLFIRKNSTKMLVKKYWTAVIIGILLPVAFYLNNLQPFLKYVFANTTHGPSWSPHTKYSLESLLWYPTDLGEVLSIYLWGIFILGLLFSLVKYKKYAVILLWILSTYIVFTFVVPFKSDRFIMPMYPAIAIISMVPLSILKSKTKLMIASLLYISIALSVFIYTSWNIGPFAKLKYDKKVVFFKKPAVLSTKPYSREPNRFLFEAKEIIDALEKDVAQNSVKSPSILFTTSIEGINKIVYQHIKYQTIEKWNYMVLVSENQDYFNKALKNADYIIAKDGTAIDDHHPPENVEKIPLFNKQFLSFVKQSDEFRLIAQEEYTDKKKIYLYKRIEKSM